MKEENPLLLKALESVPETILIVDKGFTIVKVIPNNKEIGITEEAETKRIDTIPGISFPGNVMDDMVARIQSCLKEDINSEYDFPVMMRDGMYVYLQARIVPYNNEYVIMYVSDKTDEVERIKGQHHADRTYMLELALKKNKISAFSFSFNRFNTCDRVNCNRCFQFYGETNDLLNRNKHICRALPVLSHPDDRQDFFFLFNNLRGQRINEANISFRLKDNEGNYQQYQVFGKVDAYDNQGMADLIIGNITEQPSQPPKE